MIAADLDADGRHELLLGGSDGNLYALGDARGRRRSSGKFRSAAASASRCWPTSTATTAPRSWSPPRTAGSIASKASDNSTRP